MLIEVDERMADEVALMEEAEIEALASLNTNQEIRDCQKEQQEVLQEDEMDSLLFSINGKNANSYDQQDRPPEISYGSDDDEYDHIFMDVIQEEQRMANQPSHQPDGDHDVMEIC